MSILRWKSRGGSGHVTGSGPRGCDAVAGGPCVRPLLVSPRFGHGQAWTIVRALVLQDWTVPPLVATCGIRSLVLQP